MHRWLILLTVLLIPTLTRAADPSPFTFRDPLTNPQTFAKNWDAAFGYEIVSGTLHQEVPTRQVAIVAKSHWARQVSVEAVVTVKQATTAEWKTTGVTILRDPDNYWHLTLCESPDAAGRNHVVDFHEMRDNRWLAQLDDKLPVVPAQPLPEFRWEYNHPYRLRLITDAKSITATVEELDGTLRHKSAYSFAGPAVTDGRPGLTSSGFRTDFRDFACTASDPVPAPAERTYPPYARRADAAIPGKATGFFHTQKQGDTWWVIDPVGAGLLYLCTDHANYNVHFCEALGYAPYNRNVKAKYGSEDAWAKATVTRLQEWGFNGLGANPSPSTLYRDMPHMEFMSFGLDFCMIGDAYRIVFPDNGVPVPCSFFPNVFHPRFEEFCRQLAKERAASKKGDPWLSGYFLDNELTWWGKTWGQRDGLFDECLRKPATHSAKQALVQWLTDRYTRPEALARAWGAQLGSWDELLSATTLTGTKADQVARDKQAFVELIAEKYFSITTRALREADPNHMVLGCRFAGVDNPAYQHAYAAAGKYSDIVTVNIYEKVDLKTGEVYMQTPAGRVPLAQVLDDVNKRCGGKPMMVTEWSYPAFDSGLPNKGGAGQRVDTQAQRAFCFEAFQKLILSRPYMVGSSFFMWADEPALGISKAFPEDSNYGLVNEQDEPYALLTQTAARVHAAAVPIHSGKTAEIAVLPGQAPGEFMIENTGKAPGRYTLTLTTDGKPTHQEVLIQPSEFTRIAASDPALSKPGGHMVQCELSALPGTAEVQTGDNRLLRTFITPGVKPPTMATGKHFTIAISNPGSEPTPQQVITLRGTQLPEGIRWAKATISAADTDGRSIASQLDQLPEGPELAIAIPPISPASVQTIVVYESERLSGPRPPPGIMHSEQLILDLDRLHMQVAGEMILDEIALDRTRIGRFTGLVQQGTPKSIWVRPQHTRIVDSWSGLVREVFDITAEAESEYPYSLGWRITIVPDQPWFVSQPLWVENRSTKPWKIEAVLHYPLSRIGGSDSDDEAFGALWYDAKLQMGYGVLDPDGALKTTFWKDATGAEHPDAVHAVGTEIRPGARQELSKAAAYIVVVKGDRIRAWQAASAQIEAMRQVDVVTGPLEP